VENQPQFYPCPMKTPRNPMPQYIAPSRTEDQRVVAKGELLGLCSRTSCHEPGARWYNHSTRTHYCDRCAAIINFHNHEEAQRLYGHSLCTKVG
jgi:hypothetical protein